MDFDLFDDDDAAAAKRTRAGTKFKPKAKPKPVIPVKGIAAPLIPCSQQVPTTQPSHEVEKPLNPDDKRNSETLNAASENGAPTNTVEPVVYSCPDKDVTIPVSKENSPNKDVPIPDSKENSPNKDVPIPDSKENCPPCFGESPGDNSEILIGLDSLGDFTPDLAPVLDDTGAYSEVTASHVSGSGDVGEGFDDPLFHFDDDSGCLLHIPTTAPAAEDPLTGVEFDVNLVPSQHDMQYVPPGGDFVNQDSGLPPTQDIIPDFPSVGPSSMTHAESISEVMVGDRQVNDMTTPHSDAEILGEHTGSGPKVPKKLASRRPKTKGKSVAPDHSPNDQETCTSNQTGVAKRSLRKRKNRDTSYQLVDEPEEEAILDGGLPTESASNSAACEGDEPQTKKGKRQSNKPPVEKGKKVRKRKKDNEKPDVAVKAAPRKFSRSTRRRKVDQSLLENQDNIDVQKVPIRDLILLAEHKERMAKKEATASQAPLPSQSTTKHAAHDNEDGGDTVFQDRNEYEDYAFEQDGFIDEESIPMVEENSGHFNYQTFMSRTRGPRWTKQDTELFYEAVQQFGTDLSMIQQLFPGRSRRQIKLKYKKEERQHPLRLREAVINRSEGHSHFETVIERLRQMAAEEKEKKKNDGNNNDDSYDLEQDEEASEAKDGGEEEELTAKVDKVEMEPEPEFVKEDEIPAKSDESEEEEMFSWSEYKSEL